MYTCFVIILIFFLTELFNALISFLEHSVVFFVILKHFSLQATSQNRSSLVREN